MPASAPVWGIKPPIFIGIGSRFAVGSLAAGSLAAGSLAAVEGLPSSDPHAASTIAITLTKAIHDVQLLPESRLNFTMSSSMTLVVASLLRASVRRGLNSATVDSCDQI